MPQPSQGICALCQETVNKNVVAKHLLACRAEHLPSNGKPVKHLHLLIEGEGVLGRYWMHLDVPASATLADLDEFLRDAWLECCGHLSSFTINGEQYDASPDREWSPNAKSMNVKLYNVLQPNSQFRYEYDFGSTTELAGRVVVEHERPPNFKKPVHLLIRNNTPETVCASCGKEATQICGECYSDEPGLFCDACAPKHEHEDMFLSIVNSPRTGVCGYEG